MPKSRYFELLQEIDDLTRGATGKFGSVGELGEMLRKRADFVHRADAALQAGELTQEQHTKLIEMNRRHSLGR